MKKCVLVTGACINTGVDIVEKFASEGWGVIFTGRDKEKVLIAEKAYKEKFPTTYIKGYAINSLLDERTVDEKAVCDMFSELDKEDVFVYGVILNAADQGLNMEIFNNPLTDFMKVINTNVCWNYFIAEQAALRMKDNGGGSILFVNSNTAYRAIPNRIAYETSKGAQLGMMRGLALDLGKYNIRVNAILPGMIKTERWDKNPDFYAKVPSRFSPLGNVIEGKEIAEACYYFIAHSLSATGAELLIDGGNTIQLYPVRKEL